MQNEALLAQGAPRNREADARLRTSYAGLGPIRRSKPAIPWLLWPLLVYLAAVIVFGKGPTYVGYAPIYWGEVVLAIALIWVGYSSRQWSTWRPGVGGLSAAIFGFLGLGAVLTAWSFPQWATLDVLRDSAIWYYAFLYFVGLAVAQHPGFAPRVWRILCRFWVVALIWGVADFLAGGRLSNNGLMIVGNGLSVTGNSGSELAENMAIGALIVLAGLVGARGAAKFALYVLALTGLAAASMAPGRGVKVGLALAILVAAALYAGRGRASRLQRKLPVVALGLGLAFGVYSSVSQEDLAALTHADRFSEISSDSSGGTTWWRLLWWQRLTDEVMTRNPLFGLGFGQSLDVYNPYLVGDDQRKWPVRSPHNFNMTVFSRMGIIGAAVWAVILLLGPAVLALRLWKGGFAGRKYAPDRKEELLLCLMLLVASWGNASFGVLLEGPAVAIPFWFVMGFAMGRSVDLRGQPLRLVRVSCAS